MLCMTSFIYFQETLVEFLEKGAEYLEKAQRFEILGDIYKLIIPIYEKLRNFKVTVTHYFHYKILFLSLRKIFESNSNYLEF